MLKVRFQGEEFLLVGSLADGGPIARESEFVNGQVSFAHLYADGVIQSFGTPIGTRVDLEIIGDVPTPTLAEGAFTNVMRAWDRLLPGPRWFR